MQREQEISAQMQEISKQFLSKCEYISHLDRKNKKKSAQRGY